MVICCIQSRSGGSKPLLSPKGQRPLGARRAAPRSALECAPTAAKLNCHLMLPGPVGDRWGPDRSYHPRRARSRLSVGEEEEEEFIRIHRPGPPIMIGVTRSIISRHGCRRSKWSPPSKCCSADGGWCGGGGAVVLRQGGDRTRRDFPLSVKIHSWIEPDPIR
jgi:hypothetical protein